MEYDADSEDDGWLENINRGQDRLSVQKFELMIWKLELANAAANERTLSAAGAPSPAPPPTYGLKGLEYTLSKCALLSRGAGQAQLFPQGLIDPISLQR